MFRGAIAKAKRTVVKATVGAVVSVGALEYTTHLPSQGRSSVVYHTLSDQVVTPVLRKVCSPEQAHDLAVYAAQRGLSPTHHASAAEQRVTVASTLFNGACHFDNPIGLAAGFDKDGVIVDEMLQLGFGFVEIGTVTPQPQPGNPQPRMFRLVKDKAIINRYGFNSAGANVVQNNLKEFRNRYQNKSNQQDDDPSSSFLQFLSYIWNTVFPSGQEKHKGLVGVNIGKNKATPNNTEDVIHDYVTSIQQLGPYADYLVINISSPNTPGLRELQQQTTQLRQLLTACIHARNELSQKEENEPEKGATTTTTTDSSLLEEPALPTPSSSTSSSQLHLHPHPPAHPQPPLLIKVAPDLTDDELREIAVLCLELHIDGIIICNTTITRPSQLFSSSHETSELGGLSGLPLKDRSTHCIRVVYEATQGSLPIIGVGGVSNGRDAYEKLRAGASLVQVYSMMIYEGPGLISRIRNELAELMIQNGKRKLSDVVGLDHDDIFWAKEQQHYQQHQLQLQQQQAQERVISAL